MSDPQPSGFKGFVWAVAAVWVGALGPSLAGWLFPSVDAFFEKGGRAGAAVWAFLTTTWSVPAVPLVLGVVLAAVGAWRAAAQITRLSSQLALGRRRGSGVSPATAIAATVARAPAPTPRFNNAESNILQQLLNADGNRLDTTQVTYISRMPALVIEAAATSLLTQGLIERGSIGYTPTYGLTPAGKQLMIDAWNAHAG